MQRQRLFIETSVALKVGTKDLPEAQWQCLVRYLGATYDFVVSPLSFFEILNRLAGGQGQYVLRNVRSLRCLSPTDPKNPIFLDMPGQFVLRVVLGLPSMVDTFQPDLLEDIWRIILEHRELIPELAAWLAEVRKQHASGADDIVEQYRLVQKGLLRLPTREEWLRTKFRQLGILSLSTEEVDRLGQRLDAAYEFLRWTCEEQLRNPAYIPTRKGGGSDWADGNQLWYLADPGTHMLYLDKDFRVRAGRSAQKAQLLHLRDALQDASDYQRGTAVLERREPTISLSEMERRLGR